MIKKLSLVIALCMMLIAPGEAKANAPAVYPVDCYVFDQNTTELTINWSRDMSADGYEVYRSNTMTGDFKKIATINNGMVNQFITKNPKARTFRYKVRAYKDVNTSGMRGRIYGDFGEELVVSTKVLETKTLGKYIEKHKGINYHFYNVGNKEGYDVTLTHVSSNTYGIFMRDYKANKSIVYGDMYKYTIQVKKEA